MRENIRGMIFDIDGVLEFQGELYPGAIETIDWLKQKGIVVRFLTNSTLKSRRSCAERLQHQGFSIEEEEVVTASYATAHYLKSLHPMSCWVMLEREGLEEFREFRQDAVRPEYLVIGDNRSLFDFDHLNKALRLLFGGARLIGMQPELVDASMGDWELNVGSWVNMLETASGVKATYIGKPAPYIFELTVKSMGLSKEEIVMVGDKVATDLVGAYHFGLRSVLLQTGEFDLTELDSQMHPDFMLESIRDIPALFE